MKGKSYIRKICYICEKEFSTDKKYRKVRDHCHYTEKYRGAAQGIYNLRYKILKEIPVVFRNGSTYDYHFIITKEHDNGKTIVYMLKFIDSYRFMQDSLSKLVDNLSDINNKGPENKFIDNTRFMTDSLLQIDRKISQIDKK